MKKNGLENGMAKIRPFFGSFKNPLNTVHNLLDRGIAEVEINDVKILESDLFGSKIMNAHSDVELVVANGQISCFSFWKVFEKRFLDYYHLEIITQTLFFFKKELGGHLRAKFSPHLNKNVQDMITETQNITSRRINLQKSIDDLEKAREELQSKL